MRLVYVTDCKCKRDTNQWNRTAKGRGGEGEEKITNWFVYSLYHVYAARWNGMQKECNAAHSNGVMTNVKH